MKPGHLWDPASRAHLPQGLRHLRTGQLRFVELVDTMRLLGFVARRQYGKTSTAAIIAIRKMARTPNHTVIFGSVKLDLGREIVRKEADVIQHQIRNLATQSAQPLNIVDNATGKTLPRDLTTDDFADLYEHSRLEFRLYHTRTTYSRTKVVALTPSAVGETGDLILDEVGRVRDFRATWEAVTPIIASRPDFRCILTTTPPPDDTHYSFELLSPPVGAEFPTRPEGNLYASTLGIPILRLSADDAHADGVPLYDMQSGRPITPDEARQASDDKDAWDRNYRVRFTLGGTGAVSLLALSTAQTRGQTSCRFAQIESEPELLEICAWLSATLGPGQIGLGVDLATTESGSSNPTSFTVLERDAGTLRATAIITWKAKDPALARHRITQLVRATAARKAGGRPRRLCVDGSNERYFAADLATHLQADVPVSVCIAGTTAPRQAGQEPTNLKTYQGSRLVATLDANQLTLPAHRYITEDWRLVRREKGNFVTDISPDGKHGDTFDSTKLALHALEGGDQYSATVI